MRPLRILWAILRTRAWTPAASIDRSRRPGYRG